MSPLKDLSGLLRAGVEEGLQEAGKHILDVARENAPKDTGELADSATAKVSGNRVEIAFDSEYALYQHESMTYEHTSGGPKFLEKALASEADAAARLIGEQIRKQLGG